MTEHDLAQLLEVAFFFNVAAVFVALVLYDVVGCLLGGLRRRLSPTKQGCTPAGGVGADSPGDTSTLGAVSTPAVSCRTAGQDSEPCPACGRTLKYSPDRTYRYCPNALCDIVKVTA